MKSVLYIAIGFLLLSSCGKAGKKAVSVEESTAPFHSVELNDVFDVSLVEDSVFYLEIIGTSKMVEGVEVRVEDSTLYLDRKNGNRWYRPGKNEVQVIIHSKPLELVVANKSCFVSTVNPITSYEFGLVFKDKSSHGKLDLNCYSFYFWNNEPTGGYLELSGTTNFLKIWNAAIMTVDAKNVTANYARIENYSKGDCTATVNGFFDYVITGFGDIHLYGAPSVINEIQDTGDGELIVH